VISDDAVQRSDKSLLTDFWQAKVDAQVRGGERGECGAVVDRWIRRRKEAGFVEGLGRPADRMVTCLVVWTVR